jgi:hypothetical protein
VLTDYIHRLLRLDAAVAMLDRYLFAPGAPPAVYAWFGDHQAYYDGDSPPYRYVFDKPDYVTQFQMRANFPTPAVEPAPLLDIAFIPSLLNDLAGVKVDDYFSGLSAMRRLCHGALEDCGDRALVDSYEARVFSPALDLFERK